MQRRCEQIGYTLERHDLDQVYRAVISHADREKVVSDRDLAQIVTRTLGISAPAPAPPAPAAPAQDFGTTPAEFGYGHGV